MAILRAANAGPVVRRMNGPDRAMLYAVAGYTGLRASELASLTPECFDLDADPVAVDQTLAADPALAGSVAAEPGVRVARAVDGFEIAVRAITTQQVSLSSARTTLTHLLACLPDPAGHEMDGGHGDPRPTRDRTDRPRGGAAVMNFSRCTAAWQRASFGTRRPQVRILPARPCPCSSANEEHAVTARGVEGLNPSRGANARRRNSVRRVLACRARSRGFDSRRCRQSTARSSNAKSSWLLPRRLQVRLLPRRPCPA